MRDNAATQPIAGESRCPTRVPLAARCGDPTAPRASCPSAESRNQKGATRDSVQPRRRPRLATRPPRSYLFRLEHVVLLLLQNRRRRRHGGDAQRPGGHHPHEKSLEHRQHFGGKGRRGRRRPRRGSCEPAHAGDTAGRPPDLAAAATACSGRGRCSLAQSDRKLCTGAGSIS